MCKNKPNLFLLVQRMFLLDNEFDKAMIHFIRNSTKRFLEGNSDHSLNGLPI